MTSEAEFLSRVMYAGRDAGLLVHHAVNRCPGCGLVLHTGTAGLPDLVLVGWNGMVLRELKSRAGILLPSQRPWRDRLAGNHFSTPRGDVPVWDIWREPVDWASGRVERELAAIT